MPISELMNSPYQQKIWELKEWISRGILFNECPSFAENLTPFLGGPWDGKLRILPRPRPDEWVVEEEQKLPVSAVQVPDPVSQVFPEKHRYFRAENLMIHSDVYDNSDLDRLWELAARSFERNQLFHLEWMKEELKNFEHGVGVINTDIP